MGVAIMSDERELVERLATIDATPRARWVAELRADLDATWDTADLGDLDSLRRQTVTLVETEPTPSEPSSGRRWAILIAAAAAVVLVGGVLVVFDRDEAPPADQPAPTVTVPPTTPLQELPNVAPGPLVPGTYFVDEVSGTPTPRIFATIGDGWWDRSTDAGWALMKGGPWLGEAAFDEFLQHEIGFMSFSHPDAVYSDACHWGAGKYPGPVDTVDGLVTALIEQRGWADVTAPSDISVDGYVGKAFQRTAPADMSDCTTRIYRSRTSGQDSGPHPDFRSWEIRGDFNTQYEPGQTETLWVLDLDGTMVVISTGAWPEPSAGAPADFAADVLNSIRIDPRALPNVHNTDDERDWLEPGMYVIDEVNGTPTRRIFATLDSGWSDVDGSEGWMIAKGGMPDEGGIGLMTITKPVAVFSDACHPSDGFYPGPVDTVDGFVTALREQQGGWVDVTAPSDISVDGYVGKAFQRTAPAVLSGCTSLDGSPRSSGTAAFPSWESSDGINDGYAPGQVETLWVLDIDGTLVVISTELWPGPSATAHADFADAVLDSIRIDRG